MRWGPFCMPRFTSDVLFATHWRALKMDAGLERRAPLLFSWPLSLGERETLMLSRPVAGVAWHDHRGRGRPVHVWDIFIGIQTCLTMSDVCIGSECALSRSRFSPLDGMAHVGGRFPFLRRLLHQHATRNEPRFFSFPIAEATQAAEGFRASFADGAETWPSHASVIPALVGSLSACVLACWVRGEMYLPEFR